jgi:FkbH-like protein
MDARAVIDRIKSCNNYQSMLPFFEQLNYRELNNSMVTIAARKLNEYIVDNTIKIAYLSNFTIDILPDYVNTYAACEGLKCSNYIGAYNQYYQEILNESGGLLEYDPDIIFIALSMNHFDPEIYNSYLSLSKTDIINHQKKIIENVHELIEESEKRFRSSIFICNFPEPSYPHAGIADSKLPYGEIRFYNDLNTKFNEMAQRNHNVNIVDIARLNKRCGEDHLYNPKLWHLAKMLWSEKFMMYVAEEILRHIIAFKGLTRKCLVLDLDNTLWGGIVGEDGPLGIKIGPGDPIGEAFTDFQFKIRALKDRGILLAICSKNSLGDVIEVFNKNKNMPLKYDDFAAREINWDHKYINIQKISQKLNIGLDSMVFIDDNPFECEMVREMLPQVKTCLIPEKPEDLSHLIDKIVLFEKTILIEDDKNKTEQYQQNEMRKELKENVGKLESYLYGLDTTLSIRFAEKEDLSRIHQLFTKTNQFNVTTARYTVAEINEFLRNDNWDLRIFSAKDRFGNLGIIGLYLIEKKDSEFIIDSFVLSCRALGRNIECAAMNYLKRDHCNNHLDAELFAFYSPTAKNKPSETFFEEQGFEVISIDENGNKKLRIDLNNLTFFKCPWIKIEE